MKREYELTIGGRFFKIGTGEIAKLADSSVSVQYGDSLVLVSVCRSEEPLEDVDITPLMVEYREKTYAAGKIPGGFFKREGKPSEKEVLTARMIDRPIRPLIPEDFTYDIQITAFALSSDLENDTDILAVNGASLAMCLSDIPFDGPIGAVRIGYVNGEYIVNPTFSQLEESELDLVCVTTVNNKLLMLEGMASQLGEDIICGAVELGMKEATDLIDLQLKIARELGKVKISYTPKQIEPELVEKLTKEYKHIIYKIIQIEDKEERKERRRMLEEEAYLFLGSPEEDGIKGGIKEVFEGMGKEAFRHLVLEEGRRPDGRGFRDIREINCKISVLPRTHGSALFTRGQTQALVVTTLGSVEDEQLIDALEGDTYKKFILHYNFPPFSVGEVKPIRGVSRREIGHGALAEKALSYVIPNETLFPYTIRVVSDILESNGSSSMATVCGASLSLMDAGVPIKAPVAGIAIGLVSDEKKHCLLSDIQGMEDHYGEMDLKVAGTRDGITAIQMDLKIKGITFNMLKEGMDMARSARLEVLDIMSRVIDKPKKELSPYAPRIRILQIPVEKIGEVIGPGGKMIRKIINDTGVDIDIKDDGRVFISSTNSDGVKKAVDIIESLTEDVEVGKIYKGRVVRIAEFGAFIEIPPGKEGLCHISQLDVNRVGRVEDIVKVGDEVMVKLMEIDDHGRLNLSRKQALVEMGVVKKPEQDDHDRGRRKYQYKSNRTQY
ncbi:MAG: polyribonucleotide nucleotidyltransferase [bacterium]